MTDDDLVALERAGWEALRTSRGAEHHRDSLADDALMAFPFGVLDREQSLQAMATAAPWSWYELQDPRVLRLGTSAAVVLYAVRAQREGQPPFTRLVAASGFLRCAVLTSSGALGDVPDPLAGRTGRVVREPLGVDPPGPGTAVLHRR